jgi:hypothetical protein
VAIDIPINALSLRTVSTVLLAGILPLLLVSAIVALIGKDSGSHKLAVFITVSLCILTAGTSLWQLSSVRFFANSEMISVGGGFYRTEVPVKDVLFEEIRARSTSSSDVELGVRTSGIGMPGLSLGWFRLREGGSAFSAVTDPSKVVIIPTRAGYTILVSADDPEALAGRLHDLK